ncbi:MAG TPA: hypothetical protein VGK73_21385 [Polyangiaceae bacterium]
MTVRSVSLDELESGPSPKLAEAEREVALAQAKFREELRSVSRAGERITTTIVKSARPVLIGVAVVTGVGLMVTLWRSRRRGSTLRSALPVRAGAPARPFWWELGRAAVVALASSAGRHLAGKLAEQIRLETEMRASIPEEGPRPPADS